MRRRLRYLANLIGIGRPRSAPPPPGAAPPRAQSAASEEQRSAEELTRRLDETHERLKQEISPTEDL